MTDVEDRARRAGAALRTWTPTASTPAATAVAARARRRTHRHRALAGTAVLGVVAGVGLVWLPGGDGDPVRTGPAGTVTTEPDGPVTTAPSTTRSTTETTDADPGPGAGPSSTTVPTTTAPPPPPEAASGSCTGQAGGTTYEVTLPDGWYANEAWEDVPACRYFAPEPVELRRGETEADPDGVHSNAAVQLALPYEGSPPPGSFDERVSSDEQAAGVTDTRRTTVDGRPASRIERSSTPGDGEQGGVSYTTWRIDLGADEVWFTAISAHDAALDAIVGSLRFSG